MKQTGMTLVEVLVALAIVATTLVAGGQAFAALSRQTERAAQMWLAQLCADNALVGHRLQQQMLPIGAQNSRCEQMGRTFELTSRVSATPNPSFRRVEVAVHDAQGSALLYVSALLARY